MDGELVRETRAGSLSAFEELVYRYEQRIFRFVSQSAWCDADAREITQDTFVKAFRSLDQFHPDRSFSAWLFAIARRRQVDQFRSAQRRPSTPLEDTEPCPAADPAEQMANLEEGDRLWALARQCLPPAQFEVLWLKYVEDMEVSGIAQAVRKTVPHVKILLFRARRNLGKTLSLKPNSNPELSRVAPRSTQPALKLKGVA
jgi:RNA polymerase sigma-70 factor (ECF subfamily)